MHPSLTSRPLPAPRSARPGQSGRLSAVAGTLLAMLMTMSWAQTAPRPVQQPAPVQTAPAPLQAADVERLAAAFIETETARLPGRVEYSLGKVDLQRLAPCSQAEAWLPTGSRLWGRGLVGVRCQSGASWSVLVPVQVKVLAPVLVANRSLPAGEAPAEGDLRTEEADLTRESGAVGSFADIAEAVLTRPLTAGQVLRRDQFRARPVIAQGDQVRIVYAGPGFRVTGSGKSLAAAADGQSVRVQLDTGKILTGTARAGRVVEMSL